ncbi:MAG: SpoIIE family protein phosphatase [Oscillospiraceae bacterium]|nr:SpoIIE family protein phosphatase [Oscillospiraceae bacterium]
MKEKLKKLKKLVTQKEILLAIGWGFLALFMELGSSTFSAAPNGAALAAGLSGIPSLCAMAGGALGALLHGFPAGLAGLGAVGIVLAARLIPDFGKPKLRAAERAFAALIAVFFSRVAETENPSELLSVIVAAATAGVFALCVNLLTEAPRGTRSEHTENLSPKCAALCGIALAGIFMALGSLDYTYINIGRAALGAAALALSARRGGKPFLIAPMLCGVCMSVSGEAAALAAVITASALASVLFLSKNWGRGKIVRAVGFVFMCAAGMLVTNVDEGGYRVLAEAAVSGILFATLPLERALAPSGTFADKGVAAMIHERLNFAADAIAGIGSGIAAAAEVLDKKYSQSAAEIADKAADRVCRSCPNSMTCWGAKYELFHKEFARLVVQLRTGFELTEFSLSPECAELCVDPNGVVKAVSKEYSRYVSAMADERRVRELRRIYTDQLSGVRDILRDMGTLNTRLLTAYRDRPAEERAERVLRENGVERPQAFVMQDKNGKLRVEAYGATEPRVTREYLGTLLAGAIGCELELPEIGGSNERFRILASERTRLSAKVGAYQLAYGENRVCGDCYDCFTAADGALYVILSDGMGTGSRARVDSAMACSVLSKLLKSGVALSAALETVNTVLMVKSADESYATLDICKIDLNTGECAVYKAGAATTYIKSSDRLIRASLSSPPAGTGGKLTVPAQKFSVRKGDVIVMMTDGANPDEQWLSRELSKPADPDALSERIAKAARAAECGRGDDISVVAVTVGS